MSPICKCLQRGQIHETLKGSRRLALQLQILPLTIRRRLFAKLARIKAAQFQSKKGSRELSVPLNHVEALARNHITAIEISCRLNVTTRQAYELARRGGVPKLGVAGFCCKSAEEKLLGMAPFESAENQA